MIFKFAHVVLVVSVHSFVLFKFARVVLVVSVQWHSIFT